jgi:hypothetical protein
MGRLATRQTLDHAPRSLDIRWFRGQQCKRPRNFGRSMHLASFKRMSQSLQSNPVLPAVFDNTQIGIQQKHQREGASSSFLKMTAKMFVKVQNHWADAVFF